jgi:hypothetical protein
MNVDHPSWRDTQDLGPENMAIRDHDPEVGLEAPEARCEDISYRAYRLEYRNSGRHGGDLCRRGN